MWTRCARHVCCLHHNVDKVPCTQADADLITIAESGYDDAACGKLRSRVDALKRKQKEKESSFAKRMFG